MPSNAAIVINDGAATPVAHTFTPIPLGSNAMSWVDKTGPFPSAYPKITATFRPPTNGSKVYKETWKIEVPTGSIVDGVAIVNDTATFFIDALLPENGTLQSRKDAKAYVKNLFANSLFADCIEGPEFVF